MTSDRYVKSVLTVIAACLVYICIALTTGPAAFAEGEREVVIVGWKGYYGGSQRMYGFIGPGLGDSAPLPVTTK